jgi:hypothetical protein
MTTAEEIVQKAIIILHRIQKIANPSQYEAVTTLRAGPRYAGVEAVKPGLSNTRSI